MIRFGIGVLLHILIALESFPALAQAPPLQAAALERQGGEFYRQGKYDEAIASFKKAYELSGAAGYLFNIAQAYRVKGDCAAASRYYTQYLVLAPVTPHRRTVEGLLRETEACSQTQPPAPQAENGPPKSIGSAPALAGSIDAQPRGQPSARRTLGWISLGVGVASLAAASAMGILALEKKDDLDGYCVGGCPPPQYGELEDYQTLRTFTTVGFAVAAAGCGAGIYLLFGGRRRHDVAHGLRLEPIVGIHAVGIRGAF
jgi:tetratricopeptide (TPR) repeat protein